jgi:phospholipase/carboxylesterase
MDGCSYRPADLPAADGELAAGCTFSPIHYEPNYAYPLIVWLHGHQGEPADLLRVMPWISLRNYVAVAPRGTRWVDAWDPNRGSTWGESPQDLELAVSKIEELIEQTAAEFHIATHRIFVAGSDGGGTMALQLGLRCPHWFAGAISVGGRFPRSHAPLAPLSAARQLPLLLLHGRDSQDYPIDQLCSDLKLLHLAGMRAMVRQYPCGQEVTTAMLSDMNAWIMQQVTGTPWEGAPRPDNILN